MAVLGDFAAKLYEQVQKAEADDLKSEYGYFTPPTETDLISFTNWVARHTQSAIYWHHLLKQKSKNRQ